MQSFQDWLPGQKSSVQDSQWSFYGDYEITKGKGTVFTGAKKSYVIMPGGIRAQTVNTNDGQEQEWVQKGAVIHVDGHPDVIKVVAVDGTELTAKRPANKKLKSQNPSSTRIYPATKYLDMPVLDENRNKGNYSE